MLDLIQDTLLNASTPTEVGKAFLLFLVLVAGGIITLAGAAALIWKAVRGSALGYLRKELIDPVQETHHQVTVNGGRNNPPTVQDKLGEISTEQHRMRDDFNNHLLLSAKSQSDLWRALEAIAKATPPPEPDDPEVT